MKKAIIATVVAALGLVALPVPAHARAASSCARYYTLRTGDTMTRVARRFNISVSRLLAMNSLADASVARRGLTVCVRAAPGAVGAVTTTIVVQAGETLTSIARKYGTTSATLRRLNRIRSVKAGQTLIVPLRRVKARGL
jgi:LysM repeat protein